MGQLQLVNFRVELRRMIGNPSITDVTDGDLTSLINRSYTQIVNKYRFRAGRQISTFSTQANIASYALPDDLVTTLLVRDTTNLVRIQKRTPGWASEQKLLAAGKPTSFVLYRNWIHLYPSPDAVYTIELYYRQRVLILSDNTDTPLIPEVWDEGILYLARFKYYDLATDVPKATYANQVWKDWIADQPEEIAEELFYDPDGQGIAIPTLNTTPLRLDFSHSD